MAAPKPALLIMDFQSGVLSMVTPPPRLFARLASLLAAARAASVPIIFVRSCLRPGLPDASSSNKAVSRVRALGPDVFVDGSTFTSFHPDAAPLPSDVVVTKRRNSALAGTDLEVLLRSLGVGHLVLAGVMTSGVVLSTLRQAADLDYRISVVEDLCVDRDEQVQEVLMRKVFPAQAEVVTVGDLVEGWGGKA